MRILILAVFFILAGCQHTGKYLAPVVEQCKILITVVPGQPDKYECGCIDKNLQYDNKKNKYDLTSTSYDQLYNRVRERMANHPEAQSTLEYMELNRENIIANKEYILNGYYCFGYDAISAKSYELLENWADENRTERIKCEL